MRHRYIVLAFALVALLSRVSPAPAQTVAAGPYLATPAWDQKLQCDTLATCPRFIVLSNWNNEAVLDRETGLVWQRTSLGATNNRTDAVLQCFLATTGGRQGWRLPRVEELLSLADPSNDTPFQDHLPAGHPFILNSAGYWTANRTPVNSGDGPMFVVFDPGPTAGGSVIAQFFFGGSAARSWCVRGGNGSDGR